MYKNLFKINIFDLNIKNLDAKFEYELIYNNILYFRHPKLKYMKIYQLLRILTLVVLMLSSCSSGKDIFYIQDSEELNEFSYDYSDYLLKSDDILKIDVKSEEPLLAKIFNPTTANTQLSNNKETLVYEGYIIDRMDIFSTDAR